jgi:hypothetical protein
MAERLPETRQELRNPNLQLSEAAAMETRLRRKMIINPKARIVPSTPPPTFKKAASIPIANVASSANLLFALVSSATFGWAFRYWQGR